MGPLWKATLSLRSYASRHSGDKVVQLQHRGNPREFRDRSGRLRGPRSGRGPRQFLRADRWRGRRDR